jgi:C-lobe and N-lobe beta barrels of Tf-binding protein B
MQSFIVRVGVMRLIPVFALMTSAISLTACAGGDGTLSAAGMVAGVNGVCGVNQSNCIPQPTGGTPPDDADNDGTPDGEDDDGTTGSGGGGNTANITLGNRAIALQKMAYTAPTDAPYARSKLSSTGAVDMAATEAAIMSANKPKTLMMETDTNAANNSEFSVPMMMNEDVYGTRDLRWVGLNHTTVPGNSIVITDRGGRQLRYDSASNSFRYFTATGFTTEGPVDMADNYYWDQVKVYMGSKANGGIKENYREYAIVSESLNRDEVLQVWAWDDSYTAQLQNQSGGGTPKQQAWSFGGRATTNMPTGGTATYKGRYVGTAETSNWVKPDSADIDPNVPWMVQGSSELTANFATNQVNGVLKTESWTSWQSKLDAWYTWNTYASSNPVVGNVNGTPSIPNIAEPNYAFYSTELKLAGTIVSGDTTVTTVTPAGPVTVPVRNAIVGTATYSGDIITSDNPMLAGFFGNNASEITGVFTASGTAKDPRGGSTGLNDARRAYIKINGSFNADCTTEGTCAP